MNDKKSDGSENNYPYEELEQLSFNVENKDELELLDSTRELELLNDENNEQFQTEELHNGMEPNKFEQFPTEDLKSGVQPDTFEPLPAEELNDTIQPNTFEQFPTGESNNVIQANNYEEPIQEETVASDTRIPTVSDSIEGIPEEPNHYSEPIITSAKEIPINQPLETPIMPPSFFPNMTSESSNKQPEIAQNKEINAFENTKSTVNNEPPLSLGNPHIEESANESKVADNISKTFPESTNIFGRKIYISFEQRIIFSLIIILLLFFSSCILLLEALHYGKEKEVISKEESSANYKVCLNKNNYYTESCLGENMEYVSSLIDTIKPNLKYKVSFSEKTNYNLSYHVVAIMKIYNTNDNQKVLYENEDLLVKKTKVKDFSDTLDIDTNLKVNYNKYNNYVMGYRNNYFLNASASLEIVLYLDEEEGNRKVSSILFPLGEPTFNISKHTITPKEKTLQVSNDSFTNFNSIFIIIGLIFLIAALILLFRTTRLVLTVATKKNEYQARLKKILREYDQSIVVARDGYVTNVDKTIVKVTNFKELLDAKENLQKPIIYSKVNNVKSEFIVEDDEKLYIYVMKEADFLNNHEEKK